MGSIFSKLFLFVAALSLVGSARASDDTAKAKFEQAKTLYADRTSKDKVETALSTLDQAVQEAEDETLKYDLLVFQSKVLYWKANHAEDAQKVALFEEGRLKSEAAKKINDDFSDGYYWAAANLARWGESNGVIASLSKKKELIKMLEDLAQKTNRDGQPGETYEAFGSARILGRVYFKLPGFAGGSLDKSLSFLDTAYTGNKTYVLNVIWYAESLSSGTAEQKAKAKAILDELLAKDPATLNPERIPETIEEFSDAKKLRAQLG